jgi:hypothetical protein
MQEFYKKHTKSSEKPSQEAIEQAAREAERLEAEIGDGEWADLIAECRAGYRTPLLESDRHASRISLTKDMHDLLRRREDVLLTILKDQSILHEHGEVCWGNVVDVNTLLFNPENEHTLPVSIIYSNDPFYDEHPGHLEKISQGLKSLKASVSDDTEFGAFMKVITRDFEQILRQEMPRSLCEGRSVFYATIFVQPQHLPGRVMSKSRFPVVTNANATEIAMILPSHFWPRRFVKYWQATT